MRYFVMALVASLSLTACAKQEISMNSRIVSSTMVYSSLAAEIVQKNIQGEAKTCLLQADGMQLAQPMQKILSKILEAQELKTIDELYAKNGLDQRVLAFTKDYMFAVVNKQPNLPKLSQQDAQQLAEINNHPITAKFTENAPQKEMNKLIEKMLKAENERCHIADDGK
ncbi:MULTISPECIES: hypothetical protein [unclassified Acinetobacter]|uniref:hypothetical protein n=1 Tax=unclassified Acinetobacter TaxID=196816 RepID=UPI0035B88A5E